MSQGPQGVASKSSKRSRLSGGGLIGANRPPSSPSHARRPAPSYTVDGPLFRPAEGDDDDDDDDNDSDEGAFEAVGQEDRGASLLSSASAPPSSRVSHLPPPPKKKPKTVTPTAGEVVVEPSADESTETTSASGRGRGRGRGRGAKSAATAAGGRGRGGGRGGKGRAKTDREQMERLVEPTIEFPEHFLKLERTFKVNFWAKTALKVPPLPIALTVVTIPRHSTRYTPFVRLAKVWRRRSKSSRAASKT